MLILRGLLSFSTVYVRKLRKTLSKRCQLGNFKQLEASYVRRPTVFSVQLTIFVHRLRLINSGEYRQQKFRQRCLSNTDSA